MNPKSMSGLSRRRNAEVERDKLADRVAALKAERDALAAEVAALRALVSAAPQRVAREVAEKTVGTKSAMMATYDDVSVAVRRALNLLRPMCPRCGMEAMDPSILADNYKHVIACPRCGEFDPGDGEPGAGVSGRRPHARRQMVDAAQDAGEMQPEGSELDKHFGPRKPATAMTAEDFADSTAPFDSAICEDMALYMVAHGMADHKNHAANRIKKVLNADVHESYIDQGGEPEAWRDLTWPGIYQCDYITSHVWRLVCEYIASKDAESEG